MMCALLLRAKPPAAAPRRLFGRLLRSYDPARAGLSTWLTIVALALLNLWKLA
jgi:hypothetical protein